MKTVEQQVYEYIEDQEHYELTTCNGIIISAPDDDTLHAEYVWQNTEEAYLSVNYRCGKKEFVTVLGIRNVDDIQTLTPGKLIEAYYEGLAEIVCFVALEYTYSMSFQKVGDTIIASNERGLKHNVPVYEKLEINNQFIIYAKRYYELMQCSEN